MSKFEEIIFDYINSMARYTKLQPLNLGGYVSESGGIGGPPGGFVGQLPQSQVTFDLSENEIYPIPSGPTLVDNLNRIRYRINTLEESPTFAGIRVESDEVVVASGVTILNFSGDVDVTNAGGGQVNISIAVSGIDRLVASGVFNEDLSSQIGASGTHFTVSNTIYSNSLRLFYNGLREYNDYTLDLDRKGFTTSFTVTSGDTLFIDYDTLVYEAISVPSGVTLGYLQSNYYDKDQTDGLLAFKADTSHTHVEADITDLSYDAHSIRGRDISLDIPTDNQILAFDSGANEWTPTTISGVVTKTIHQQYVFTLGPDVNATLVGTPSYKIFAQDVEGGATITEVFCGLNSAPTTTPVRVNVLKNGSTIFNAPAYVQIDTGDLTASRTTNFATSTFTKDDYFQIQLVQGDNNAQYLTVHLRFDWEA